MKLKPTDSELSPIVNLIDTPDIINSEIYVSKDSNKKTAKSAVKLLLSLNKGFKEPTNKERVNLLVAFAKKNKVLYGKAFDLIKIQGEGAIDLEDLAQLEKNLHRILICEIKSTGKKNVGENFKRYFFALTTAELLVAQSLRNQYNFVFVNVNTAEVIELPLKEMLNKAKGIYPTWSIQF